MLSCLLSCTCICLIYHTNACIFFLSSNLIIERSFIPRLCLKESSSIMVIVGACTLNHSSLAFGMASSHLRLAWSGSSLACSAGLALLPKKVSAGNFVGDSTRNWQRQCRSPSHQKFRQKATFRLWWLTKLRQEVLSIFLVINREVKRL